MSYWKGVKKRFKKYKRSLIGELISFLIVFIGLLIILRFEPSQMSITFGVILLVFGGGLMFYWRTRTISFIKEIEEEYKKSKKDLREQKKK